MSVQSVNLNCVEGVTAEERRAGPEHRPARATERARKPAVLHRLVCSWSCTVFHHSSLLLLSRLECERRIWFVQNACLTVFHHHNASLWGRDFSALYTDIKALGRLVTKNFRHRDTIIHPHAKIVDGTFLYLLYNLIVHRTRVLSQGPSRMHPVLYSVKYRFQDIVCDAFGLSKRCAR